MRTWLLLMLLSDKLNFESSARYEDDPGLLSRGHGGSKRQRKRTMTSKPAVKPTYNPTSDELKSAISVAFKHEVSEKARFFCLRFTVYHHATFFAFGSLAKNLRRKRNVSLIVLCSFTIPCIGNNKALCQGGSSVSSKGASLMEASRTTSLEICQETTGRGSRFCHARR